MAPERGASAAARAVMSVALAPGEDRWPPDGARGGAASQAGRGSRPRGPRGAAAPSSAAWMRIRRPVAGAERAAFLASHCSIVSSTSRAWEPA